MDLALAAGGMHDEVHEALGPRGLRVRRHDEVGDVAVDRLGLGHAEHALGNARHGADGESAVDEQERGVRRRRDAGWRRNEEPEATARTDPRRGRDVRNLGRAAAVAAEQDLGLRAVGVARKDDEVRSRAHAPILRRRSS